MREAACPFCGAAVSSSGGTSGSRRRSRFAIFGAAAITTACGSVQALYGAVVPDASADGGDGGDATTFDAPATFYGAVFPDAGKD